MTLSSATLTVCDRVAAASSRGVVTFIAGDATERIPWAQVHEESLAVAARLQARGLGPGHRVALLGPTSRPLVTVIQATWLAGATVVVLPLPMRMAGIDDFVAQTRARVHSAAASLVVIDDDLAPFLEPALGDPPTALLRDLVGGAGGPSSESFEQPIVAPTDLAILQFTSGSTADPKGVMLPHGQVCANLDAIAEAAALDVDRDVLVSWLPLYHDMGLIGLLMTAMSSGADLVLAGPQDFMASPGRWMEWMSAFGGTATAGPNFSYVLAARALRRMSGLDLSAWRIGLNGAEPVDPASVEAFCEAAAPHRLDPRAMFPAFGMAEATLAVTFPEPFSGMHTDTVDPRVLETDRYAAPVDTGSEGGRRMARLGRPVPGMEIRIVDPATGDRMLEREAGELEIRGTSVTPGYFRHEQATAAAFHDGWLRTGDLAYVVDGELVVCGRIKDVIIVGGRNVFPEDVERAAATVEGVRAGNVIAFGVDGRKGREGLVVVAETKADDPVPVRAALATRVREAVGLRAEDIVLVSPGTLPKTSSGKLQRSLCRTRYLGDELAPA